MSDAAEDRQLVLGDAAPILAEIKAIPAERRMNALALAVRVFCDTRGTLELADA